MERNDRAFDELFNDPKLKMPLEHAFATYDPSNEDNPATKASRMILFGHLKKVLAFMSGLGVSVDIDLATAQKSLAVCSSSLIRLKAMYNRWRLEQSDLVASKLRDAIDILARANRPG